jgi:undecaprenyl-diphosphatase
MTSLRLTRGAYDNEVRGAGLHLAAGVGLVVALVLAAAGVGERAGALSGWQALVLGIVQGATELLPISSSGHLILIPWLGDWQFLEANPEFNKTFDVALHLGTLVAVVLYFRREIATLIAAWLATLRRREIRAPEERIAWYVAAATVPAALAGAVGESFVQERLGEPWQIAVLLAVFGVGLWIADRAPERRDMAGLGFRSAVSIGLAQALALAPGVSRSGVTISAARALGVDRDSAARFSFLLLVPVVLGAVLYKGVQDVLFGTLPPGSVGPFVIGTLAAAGSGLLAISALLGYLRRRDYSIFVVYRLLAAAAVGAIILAGVRDSTF